jgi:hypothetical protein
MDLNETALQLYKVEYEKAADRYDNIYRSMWTIFSYLTAVTAGFLAFASDRIEPHLLISIAAIPLLFWFWTTYLPLDRYGNLVVNRLCEIEDLLNSRFGTELTHFHGPAHGLSICVGMVRAIIKPDPYSPVPQESEGPHPKYPGLQKCWHRFVATVRDIWNQVHRARFAILVLFIALHAVVIYSSGVAWKLHEAGQPLFLAKPAVARSVVPMENVTIIGNSK